MDSEYQDSETDVQEHEAFIRQRCPNDLGGEHYWGWISAPRGNVGDKDIFYAHRCKGGRLQLGTIDVTTPVHTLVSADSLHVEPSVLCRECGDHGHIRGGQWAPA